MEFEVGIRPSAEKPLLEGSGTLGDVTVIMGRPRTGKSLFLRYLFALLSEDYELAIRASEQILDNGGWARLRVGDILLSCSKSDEGEVGWWKYLYLIQMRQGVRTARLRLACGDAAGSAMAVVAEACEACIGSNIFILP
jgi:hypothetical protein